MQKVALAQGILSDSNTPGLRDHPALSVGNLPSLGDGVHPLVYSFLLSRRIENCSQATITSYKDRISCMMRFVGKDPLAITKADIESWLLHLRESESRRGGKRSAHFIRSNFNAVRPFFNWLVAEGHLDKSPVANMKPPKVPKYEKEFLSEEEFHRLLSLCSNHTFVGLRDRAWLWLLWSTGCRFSELANLKRDDLFFMQNGRIVVTGKGNKQRAVPFTDDAQKAVFRYLQKRDDKYPELWISEERRPMKRLGMGAVIPRLMDAASGYQCPHCGKEYEGLEFTCREYVCPACKVKLTRLWNVRDAHHIFRRTWAYRNLKAGVSPKFVQLVGGWESMVVLEQYVRRMTSDDALSGNIKWR